MLILNPSFQGKGQFYDNFLFDILIIQGRFLAFQFLTCGIRIYLPVLTLFENRPFNSRKIADLLLKNVVFEA